MFVEYLDMLTRDATLSLINLCVAFLVLWINMPLFIAIAGKILGNFDNILERYHWTHDRVSMVFFFGSTSFKSIYFVYCAFIGQKYLGILQLISFFLIMGVGVDNFFVCWNFFKQVKDNHSIDYWKGPRDSRFKSKNGFFLSKISQGNLQYLHDDIINSNFP